MKKSNMLVTTLLVMLTSACSRDAVETDSSQQGHPVAVTLPGGTKDNDPAARLNIGKSYGVNGDWARPEWTFKGDFNGDRLWDIISLNGTARKAYTKLSQGEGVPYYAGDSWPLSNQFSSVAGYTFTGDFNGDWYSDIASAIADKVIVHINNQNQGFNASPWPVENAWGQPYNTVVGDFNGDGRDDIASLSGGFAYMKLSTGTGFTCPSWPINSTLGATGWTFAADYNGDGYDDILCVSGGTIYVKQSTSNGFSSQTYTTSSTWGSRSYTWVGDTNNNGKDELITAIGATVYVKEFNGTGVWPSTPVTVTNTWGSDGYNWVEDFNGSDGADIVSAIGEQIFVH